MAVVASPYFQPIDGAVARVYIFVFKVVGPRAGSTVDSDTVAYGSTLVIHKYAHTL